MMIEGTTQAYVNHGRWIVDCPRPFCGNAIQLNCVAHVFECAGDGGCGQTALVEWPENAQEIWDVLMERPVKATRNWFPLGHPVAVRHSCEMGQTVAQLRDEQKLMEELGA